MRSLKEISWNVTEEEYRSDPALSYSTIATYKREGFNGLDHLFDKKESESLLFGSCVDAIVTGGLDEFDSRFVVVEIPEVAPSIANVIKKCHERYGELVNLLSKIPDDKLLEIINECNYQPRWRDENRIKSIREYGNDYYKALCKINGKQLVTATMYNDVLNCVNALVTDLNTAWYFNDSQPDDYVQENNVERFYQLKFKYRFNDVDYRCMADLIVVDHDKKIIYPVDLKTSSHYEWDFFKSFIDWDYQIQARLYYRIIKSVLLSTPEYKDYKLDNYRFIVINKKSLTPLVWEFKDTAKTGRLVYSSEIILEDPFAYGEELSHYLTSKESVPIGIVRYGDNDIVNWLKKYDKIRN